ncbi:sodium-coupled monocarboxylate transporter 1-like [Bradysia coprophila]|uniref:sodium-coupled monocarboxylate transporter 1-like n=1 Tax=Bradysia coprophila TaxID=38358 RepID=UPI00187DBED3|nr:sodium-coupled monocarboxylate transporter 1-like [Bradysia coprophila]
MTNVKENVSDLNKSLQHFDWPDYAVFVLMLVGSTLIGIYFGFVKKKTEIKLLRSDRRESEVAREYLMGGRQLSMFPVALSLVASWISGISLLGLATEIYLYGTTYIFNIVSLIVAGILIRFILLPVFYNLQLTSTYEYLERRFDKRVRLFGSILYTIATLAYLPIVIYVPALSFNQVTGVNIHVVTPFVCVVCIFYTLVGGIKAVVWTDSVQLILMLFSMIVIIIKGTIDVSGLQTVWDRNLHGDRINLPELTTDLTERYSVVSLLIGGVPFYIYTCSMGQEMMQRYISLPTIKDANRALLIFIILMSALILICCYNGLLIYAWYAGCDPLQTKLIGAPDQLLPLLLMSVLGDYPGMPGLFIAGIFSAALSTLSTCLNAMAAIVLEDFCKPFVKGPLSEKQTGYVMRGSVLVVGIVSVALVFIVQHMGTVFQLAVSLSSVTGGPIFGMFTMGLICPWVKRRGAFLGGVVSLIAMVVLLIYAQHDMATGALKYAVKPLSTDGCNYTFPNVTEPTNSTTTSANEGSMFRIHHMSFLFYPIFGATVAIIVGSLTSLICREEECDLNPMLFSPFVRKFINTRVSSSHTDQRNCVSHVFDEKDTEL